MRTELVADLTVEQFAVLAEMAWIARRPELGAVCRAGRTAGGQVTAAAVQQALPGTSDVGAANIVRWCRMLRLCDGGDALTALGEGVADSDEVAIPEQGVYEFWAASHPLLGERLLHAERTSPTNEGRLEDVGPLPVEPELGRLFKSVLDAQNRMIVRSFPSNHGAVGALRTASPTQCRLRWVLNFDQPGNEFRLEGDLEWNGKTKPIMHAPERAEVDLWRVVESWALGPLGLFGRWDPRTHRLGVQFTGLAADAQDRFVRDLDLPRVEVPGFGIWSNARLEAVPIGPTTAVDARRWALSRLDRALRAGKAPLTRTAVRRMFAELTEDTPLEVHRPTLPGHDELARTYEDSPEVFWRLAAPVDLAPAPVSREELVALTIGGDAPDGRTAVDRVSRQSVRVAYGARLSMKSVAADLLVAHMPRRILLCDRFVRGAANLRSLRLLVESLRVGGQVAVDVWTGDDIDDRALADVREITGSDAMRYGDAIGRGGHPHDRYLVVDAGVTAFGWQMSNSPLDARAAAGPDPTIDTPLRWRDFTATLLSSEQLPSAMRTWLAGAR